MAFSNWWPDVWCVDTAAAEVVTVCGFSGERDFCETSSLADAVFDGPSCLCIDPIHPTSYYVGDFTSIRYVNTETDTVTAIAGSGRARALRSAFADGVGAEAGFTHVYDIVCKSDGSRLYVSDCQNSKIRSVDVKTRRVTTVAGYDPLQPTTTHPLCRPRKIVFDRSVTGTGTGKPESTLYFTADRDGLWRLQLTETDDTTTTATTTLAAGNNSKLTLCLWRDKNGQSDSESLVPWGLACTTRGQLIISCRSTSSLYLYDPPSGHYEVVAGPGTMSRIINRGFADGSGRDALFHCVYDVVLVDHERCVYITDAGNRRIRRITLPQTLLNPP